MRVLRMLYYSCMKKVTISFTILLLLCIVLGGGYVLATRGSAESYQLVAGQKIKSKNTSKQYMKRQRCTSNTAPLFTHAFTDLSVIDALNPIGGLGGGSPGRSYIGVKEGNEAPIYAPADATLQTIIYADRGAGYGEYGLLMQVSCEVTILFDHIDRLSNTLIPFAPRTPKASSQMQDGKELGLKIKAGELLGYTNGTDLARTFDFLVTNQGKKNTFLNPKRWAWDQAVYGTCPYDYFTPDLKAEYYAKLGKPSERGFIKAHECGNPSHDIVGTLSGGWFTGKSTDKWGDYLAIAREYDEVRIAYRRDGNAFANTKDVHAGRPYFHMTIYSPARYPSEIKAGESVCYESNTTWAFIKLVSNTELLFSYGNGACPSLFPEAQASAWIR